MATIGLVVVAALVAAWGLTCRRLGRLSVTAPTAFMVTGFVLEATGLIHKPEEATALTPLLELTLVWVLFADAATVPLGDFRRDLTAYARLLGIGLPLTILAGWGLAAVAFPHIGLWSALLVGAALAPTDAALGLPIVSDPRIPRRTRELVTVESGLNDGIATPVVLLAIAGAAEASTGHHGWALDALGELLLGVLIGLATGALGGWASRAARRHDWTGDALLGVAVLAIAVATYGLADLLHGNGFVAAFCAGLAFGATAGRRGPQELEYVEQTSALASLLVWLAFGSLLPQVGDAVDARVVVYAVLSLTVVRMVPVALSLLGTRTDRRTVLLIGWFGPRGLASLVFALLALEELGHPVDTPIAVIAVTVVLSVLAHGLSAGPLVTRYAATLPDGPRGAG